MYLWSPCKRLSILAPSQASISELSDVVTDLSSSTVAHSLSSLSL